MKTCLFFSFFVLFATMNVAQTSLSGTVSEENGELVVLSNVVLYQNDVFVTATETDFDGYYNIAHLDAGTYDVEVSYVGLSTHRISDLTIFARKANILDITMPAVTISYCPMYINHQPPIIQQDNTTSGATISKIARGRAQFGFTVDF